MASTLDDLTNEVIMSLAGYTMQQDKTTHLTEAITTTESTLAAPTVFKMNTSQAGTGIVEIDDERYEAFVKYVRYNDYIETSYCTVKALITEQYSEIQVELKNVYPYEEIA